MYVHVLSSIPYLARWELVLESSLVFRYERLPKVAIIQLSLSLTTMKKSLQKG